MAVTGIAAPLPQDDAPAPTGPRPSKRLNPVPYDGRTAPVRYNNPGGAYPRADLEQYGMTGYGVIGGGHPIARYETPAHGVAANMAHFKSLYQPGMTVGQARGLWVTGKRGTEMDLPGLDRSMPITDAHFNDPQFMKSWMRATAKAEGHPGVTDADLDNGFNWYAKAGAPMPPPSSQPIPQSGPASQPITGSPMARGGMAAAPPSFEEIQLYQNRAKPFMAANDGSPTTGWGALGRIASSITGAMWNDQAAKGLRDQRDYSSDLLSQYNRAGMAGPAPSAQPAAPPHGIAGPLPTAAPRQPQQPRVASAAPVSTGLADRGAVLPPEGADRATVPLAEGGALAYDTRAPAIGRPPEVVGQGGRSVTTTTVQPSGYQPGERVSANVEDRTGGNAPTEVAAPTPLTSVHSNFDASGRWTPPKAPALAPVTDVGEGETPYPFPPDQGRMGAGLGGASGGDPLAARNLGKDAAGMFAEPPAPSASGATGGHQPAPTYPTQAPALTSPRPGFAQTPDVLDTQREREQEHLLGQMMASGNPHLMQFAQGQLAAINQKRLQFGLQAQQSQLQRQQGLEQKRIEQMAEVDQMEALGAYTPDQAAAMRASINRTYGGGGAAPAPTAIGANGGVAPGNPGSGGSAAASGGGVSGLRPPGTFEGGMVAQPDVTASMVPLSEEAQRALQMTKIGGLRGNRAMVQAGENILKNDPTLEARKAQSTAMGKSAADRAEARRAGAQIMKSYTALRDYFDNLPDSELTGAIGARNTSKLKPESPVTVPLINLPLWNRPTTVDPKTGSAVAGEITPVERESIINPGDATATKNWNTQNTFHHLIHGLTNSLITNAGKGLNMSDARQAEFSSTMADFLRANDRQSAAKILDHARSIIVNDFGLTPDEAQGVIQRELSSISGHGNSSGSQSGALNEAREAIRRGAPKDAVAKRLRGMGIDPAGL